MSLLAWYEANFSNSETPIHIDKIDKIQDGHNSVNIVNIVNTPSDPEKLESEEALKIFQDVFPGSKLVEVRKKQAACKTEADPWAIPETEEEIRELCQGAFRNIEKGIFPLPDNH